MSFTDHDCSNKEIAILEFRLYIHGDTPRSKRAASHVELLCKRHLGKKYRLECVDLLEAPERALEDQILATPTLIKLNPPRRRVLGDFTEEQQLLEILGIKECR